jgi:hypothetical protein
MHILRQSTAVDVLIGPFVDKTDGNTLETGKTLDVELSKNGQGLANKNDSTAPTDDTGGNVDGYYNCELDATDTNTVGTLRLCVHHTDALPVWHDFQVVEEAIYDALFAASADLITKVDAIDTVVDAILVDTGTTIPATITTIDDFLDTEVAAILADTNELQADWANGGRLDTIIDSILTDTAVIGSAGAGLTAVPWNAAWDAEVQSECTDALNAYDPPTKAEMDATWTTAQTESYASDGATATPAQLLYMIYCAVGEFSISGTTITGKKVDGSTTAMTWTINSASDPTSRTRAG